MKPDPKRKKVSVQYIVLPFSEKVNPKIKKNNEKRNTTMKKRTSADMLCIAEYTLKHLYNLNAHTPEQVIFKMEYSPETVGAMLFIRGADGIEILHSDINYTYNNILLDRNDVYDAIARWEERYLKKETPEDDNLG